MSFDQAQGLVGSVRWYWTPEGTPWLGVPSNFGSNNWLDSTSQLPYSVGEVDGAKRKYDKGKFPENYHPDYVPCNPQWLVSGSDPNTTPLPVDGYGRPRCCTPGWGLYVGAQVQSSLSSAIAAGVRPGQAVTSWRTRVSGLRLGQVVSNRLRHQLIQGLRLGQVVSTFVGPAGRDLAGLRLGQIVSTTVSPSGRDHAGVRPGQSMSSSVIPGGGPDRSGCAVGPLISSAAAPPPVGVGVEIGIAEETSVRTPPVGAGVLLGAAMGASVVAESETGPGLELGVAVLTPIGTIVLDGLLLGVTVTSTFPSPPTPGYPCPLCTSAYTPANWSFRGSMFTGPAAVWNIPVVLAQYDSLHPCQYNAHLIGFENCVLRNAILGNWVLTVTGDGANFSTYTNTSGGEDCLADIVLTQTSSGAGGPSTITIAPGP